VAFENDLSGLGSFQSCQCVKQGGFAGSGDTTKKKRFSRLYVKIDAAQHLNLPGSNAK
jgi:hypothetical protein